MSAKQQFLKTYDDEHQRTMKVLKAFPADKPDFRPDPKCKTAREQAWAFAMEGGLGATVLKGDLGKGPMAKMPDPPAKWGDLVAAVEKAQMDFGALVRSYSEKQLTEKVTFFVGPKQMGEVDRMTICWFLLHDQIHHRGQMSVYLRAVGAKVPSIYGPSKDEPWM